MADFTAKDVQRLRQVTGAGMMDAKRALTEAEGDFEAAKKRLQEQGLANMSKRSDRENTEGAVALATSGTAASLVWLRSETDFVGKSPEFVKLANAIAEGVVAEGEEGTGRFEEAINDLKVALKENIELGRVVRFGAGPDEVLDTYLHVQSDRGVNGVLVLVRNGSQELAHDVAVHVAFARPSVLTRDEVPETEVAEQRALLETQTRNEGKPEQALPKIVEGKLGGWFKRVPGGALLEQPFVKDEKQTVEQALGGAEIVRFAPVEIGGGE